VTKPATGFSRRSKTLSTVAAGVVGLGAVAYVGLNDPHVPGSLFPQCPFKVLTGWNCPACGGLRMTHDLLHGDFSAAVVDNVFLLVGIPALVAWVVVRIRAGKPAMSPLALSVVFILSAVWTVIRNLPGFPLVPTIYTA
jgi:hypothetical protein